MSVFAEQRQTNESRVLSCQQIGNKGSWSNSVVLSKRNGKINYRFGYAYLKQLASLTDVWERVPPPSPPQPLQLRNGSTIDYVLDRGHMFTFAFGFRGNRPLKYEEPNIRLSTCFIIFYLMLSWWFDTVCRQWQVNERGNNNWQETPEVLGRTLGARHIFHCSSYTNFPSNVTSHNTYMSKLHLLLFQ